MKLMKIAMLTILALTAAGAVRAGDDGDDQVVRRQIHKVIVDCDGDDCDPDVQVMATGDHAWVNHHEECDGDECDRQVFVFKTGDATMSIGDHDFAFAPVRGFLGVQFLPLTSELSEHFEAGSEHGVMVSKVIEDSPAARAGLQVGDIVTAVNGEDLSEGGLVSALADSKGGDEVSFGLIRYGRSLTIDATLDERDDVSFGVPHGAHKLIQFGDVHAPHAPGAVGVADHGLNTDELCEGLDECEVRIQCESDDDCTCEVNGATVDCPDMD